MDDDESFSPYASSLDEALLSPSPSAASASDGSSDDDAVPGSRLPPAKRPREHAARPAPPPRQPFAALAPAPAPGPAPLPLPALDSSPPSTPPRSPSPVPSIGRDDSEGGAGEQLADLNYDHELGRGYRFEDEPDYEAEEDVEEYGRWLFEVQWPAPWCLLNYIRIDERRWVVEGHRDKYGNPEPGRFYHLSSLAADRGATSHCDCTDQTRTVDVCVHKRALARFWDVFTGDTGEKALSATDNPDCVAIISNVHGYQSWLSVRAGADSSRDESRRILVRWCGGNRWLCDHTKCRKGRQPSTVCVHRGRARQYLIGVMWRGEDWAEAQEEADAADELGEMDEANYLRTYLRDPVHARAYVETKPRSHRRIPSPKFCALPSDVVPRNDPSLANVNSSAAECGNAGIARIRKTVSYSNQAHAIKFTRNFLCVWNRGQWLKWKAQQA